MCKKIILFFFLSSFLFANSQSNIPFNESIIVNLNTSNYLVGETIYYKIYTVNTSNNLKSSLSKIAYIELIDENKNNIVKQKLILNDGIAFGDFFLPVELKTGIYKVIAYSSLMKNQDVSSFFIKDIIVINPYQSIPSLNNKQANTNTYETKSKDSKDILTIEMLKKTYSKRSLVKINIKNLITDLENNISFSVRKVDSLSLIKTTNNNNINYNSKTVKENKINEFRGEIISGKIIAKDQTKSINSKSVSVSIPGKNYDTKIVKTNTNGEFNFILNDNPNSEYLIFQVFEEDRENYKLILNEDKIDYSNLNFSNEIIITPEIKKNIENRSVSNQIENAYFSIKKDTIKEVIVNNPFYHPYEKIIKLDDYTRFPSLKETIIEILPEVFFKEKNNHYVINLRNIEDNIDASGTTLTLVDGLIIQNAEELFEFDTRNIERVEFVNQKYVYGPKIFNGIINFITKDFNYELKESGDYILKTKIQRPLEKKYYYNQDYSDPIKFERIPDYRYQLLWKPDITLMDNKFISFYTSDITGKFEISIEGFTVDGKPISIKEYFEVID